MKKIIGLLGLITLITTAQPALSTQLGTGPESIMGFSAHETTRYSFLDENTYLSVSQLIPPFLPAEDDTDVEIPALNLDYTGRATDSFYHLSLINREDDFHSLAGFTFDLLNFEIHYGNSGGTISDRLDINGIAPNFFHGSVLYPYNYAGSALGISLYDGLTLLGGASFIEAEGLEGRSVFYSGFSYKGFYATFNHVKRGDETAGYSIITGLDLGNYTIAYQELNSEYDAAWREVSVALSENEKLGNLKLSLGIGNNEYYYAGDETRLTMMYSIPLGGKKVSRKNTSFDGDNSRLADSSTAFQELKKTSLGAVGSGLALSSGDEILDGKGKTGFRFKRKFRAARKILSRWNPASIRMNREIAGTIYRNRDGTFGINSNVRLGTEDRSRVYPWRDIPRGTRPAAIWHTHGAYKPEYGAGNENFSYQDIAYFNRWKVDGYLGTPKGRMWWYQRRTSIGWYTRPGFLPTQ